MNGIRAAFAGGRLFRAASAATLIVVLLAISAPTALAGDQKSYKVRQIVTVGEKSKETDAVLVFGEKSLTIVPTKQKFRGQSLEFGYEDVRGIEYSYSSRPLLSRTQVIALSVLGFAFISPLMFIQKKSHWLSVRTDKEFAVFKLGKGSLRRVRAEFAGRGIAISDPENDEPVRPPMP